MIIVGLDLSLTSTGWCRATNLSTSVGKIESKGSATASLGDRDERLSQIIAAVRGRVYDAQLVVVESPAHGQVTGHHHDRSGLWWLVVAGLYGLGIDVAEVSPTALKKYATGKGNAAKDAVLLAVSRRYPDVPITGNDEADALVLAAMGARWLGEPIDDLPKINLEAMAAVRWPTKDTP